MTEDISTVALRLAKELVLRPKGEQDVILDGVRRALSESDTKIRNDRKEVVAAELQELFKNPTKNKARIDELTTELSDLEPLVK